MPSSELSRRLCGSTSQLRRKRAIVAATMPVAAPAARPLRRGAFRDGTSGPDGAVLAPSGAGDPGTDRGSRFIVCFLVVRAGNLGVGVHKYCTVAPRCQP